MGIATTIRNRSYSHSKLAQKVNDGVPIGGIFRLDYHSAVVLTDDFRKQQAGGVPQGGFLLAAAGAQTADGFVLDDEELILLRVRGTAPLPNEADLVQTRLAVVRDATETGVGFNQVTDELTRIELQQSAFDCEVIGTFYLAEDNREIKFGADIDSVVSSARYQVFLPSAEVLSWLASYPGPELGGAVQLGVVRYASTERRARAASLHEAAVNVRVSDFVSRKTAVFGMTRTGKSNTIKSLVTAVYRYGIERGAPIGQLIFDPQGEYANINTIDGTGLRLLGGEDRVNIYRMGGSVEDQQVRPLGMNFFDVRDFSEITEFVNAAVLDAYGTYAYVKNFCSINWSEPEKSNKSEYAAWTRARIGFYGLLAHCGFIGHEFVNSGAQPVSTSLEFVWNVDDYNEFSKEHHGSVVAPQGSGPYRLSSPASALLVAQFMIGKGSWNQSSSRGGVELPFKFIADVFTRASVRAVIRALTGFHTTLASQRVDSLIWEDMKNGRLSIVDLSYGSDEVAKAISNMIVTHLLAEANQRFRGNELAIPIQVVVEEAHNLFERGAKEVVSDPWVRLAKEAAKYEIGLIYATQEVSSVDQRILSNTSNWLIAHLNSDNETRELSHYYDFKTWADSIRRCEDVGFIRMKTYSGKYIVPIQVAKFDHAMIDAARVDARPSSRTVENAGQNALFE